MNINRRQFLGSLGAIAAAAVVISVAGDILPLPADARALLVDQAKSGGIIHGQYFEFFGPVTIDNVHNLTIDQCTFIFRNIKADENALTIQRCTGMMISNCRFDIRGNGETETTGAYIYFSDAAGDAPR